MDEMTSEAFVDCRDKRRLEPEGEAERPEATGLGSEVKGVSANPESGNRHRFCTGKDGKEGKRKSNANGEEGT